MKKSKQLRMLLEQRKAVSAIGCHDVISAKLIERSGFELIQVSGFGLAASYLGLPDMAFLSFAEMLTLTRNIINAVKIPVMADADTGFGNAVNAMYVTEQIILSGAAGMNLEDQIFPKRCGHLDGKNIISTEEMVLKIKACKKIRDDLDRDFVINARTDAIVIEGIEGAIKRGNAYLEAGADMIFVEAPSTKAEIEQAVSGIKGLVSINLFDFVEGGKTPLVPIEELAEMGVARVSVPTGTIFSSIRGVSNYLDAIKGGRLAKGRSDLVTSFDEFKELVGIPGFRALEKEFLPAK